MTLQHVSLEVRREAVPEELRFWALLGFTPVAAPGTLGERSAWVQRGDTQVHLLFAEAPVVPPSGHTAVIAGDYDAAIAALGEAGFAAEERRRHWGAARAYVRSPAGHLVELMAEPPPA